VLPPGIEQERPPIQQVYAALAADEARNAMIFNDVLQALEAERSPLAQYVGRLHRLYPAKREVIVYDYVDETVPMLKRMSEKRIRGLQEPWLLNRCLPVIVGRFGDVAHASLNQLTCRE
jgi:hypothetical protein